MSLLTLTSNGNTNVQVQRRHFYAVALSGTFGGATVAVQYSNALPVAASITTALTGTNNDFVLTRRATGTAGNIGTLTLTNSGASKSLAAIVLSPHSINLQLATNSGGSITTTASDIISFLNSYGDVFSQNYTIALAAGNNGSGVVTALTATNFAGGTNGTFNTYASGDGGSFTAAGERVFVQSGISDFINVNVTNASGSTNITCVVTNDIDY